MDKPKYLFIKDDLKDKILKEVYLVDSKIPSEIDLREKYKVSRHTIRQAISELVNEGYLIKVHGSGTFVSDEYLDKNNSKKNMIGIITTYLSDYIFPSIIRGIERELSKHNYSLMLASTHNNVKNERDSLENMFKNEVAGLIIEPTKSNMINPNLNYYLSLIDNNTPLLMLHANYEELDIPFIGMDDIGAGEVATSHLIELGHKKIAIITKTDDVQGKNRFKGYINALRQAKISYQNDHIILYDTEQKESLSNLIHELLINDSPPTAIVCYNDQIAMEVIGKAKQLGLNVPDDLSIVSHDNSFLSTPTTGLNLTTIEHPKEKMGSEAAKWIINVIENKDFDKKPKIFPPNLIIRESTKEFNKTKKI